MGSQKTPIKRSLSVVFVLILLLIFISTTWAQSPVRFAVEWIDSSLYPTVEVYLGISDAQGFPLSGLVKEDFSLQVAGEAVENFEVTPVHNTDQPLAIVLVIDTSGSMEAVSYSQTAMEQAVEAAGAFLGKLSPEDRVALISFADEVNLVQDLIEDKTALETGLASLETGGGTRLYDAVYQGTELLAGVPERKVVIFLTDGKESGASEYSAPDVALQALEAGVPVYPIGFGDVNADRLNEIAETSGGYAQIQPDAAALEAGFNTVLSLLRNQYLLRFQSILPADNTQQNLTVTFNHQGEEFTSSASFKTQPYTIEIQSPAEGEEFSDPVPVQAAVNPDLRTKSVEFALDGEVFDTDNNPPFASEVPVDEEQYGAHVLSVTARDINGNTTRDEITVTTRPAILLEFTSHSSGDLLRGAPTLEVAADTLYDLKEVSLLIDGEEKALFSEPPFAFEWPLYNVKAGEYLIAATAIDDQGNTARKEIIVDVKESQGDAAAVEGDDAENAGDPSADSELDKEGDSSGLIETGKNNLIFLVIGGGLLLLAGVLIPLGIRKRKDGASASSSDAVLREIQGRSPGQIWPLDRPELRLGRKTEDNDIPLDGLNASRRMAVIRAADQGHVIYNLVPENPVLVNGTPITQEQALQIGDQLTLGDSQFRYQAAEE